MKPLDKIKMRFGKFISKAHYEWGMKDCAVEMDYYAAYQDVSDRNYRLYNGMGEIFSICSKVKITDPADMARAIVSVYGISTKFVEVEKQSSSEHILRNISDECRKAGI